MKQTTTDYEKHLTEVFGRDVGLNADWSVSAWRIAGTNLFVTDNEDGTLALVERDLETDDEPREILCYGTDRVREFVDAVKAYATQKILPWPKYGWGGGVVEMRGSIQP